MADDFAIERALIEAYCPNHSEHWNGTYRWWWDFAGLGEWSLYCIANPAWEGTPLGQWRFGAFKEVKKTTFPEIMAKLADPEFRRAHNVPDPT